MSDLNYPNWTISLGAFVTVLFGFQVVLAPANCPGTSTRAFCAAWGLLRTNVVLGVLLMPFLHGTVNQFLFNLPIFLTIGGAVELWHGRKHFLWLFILGGYLSTVIQVQEKIARGDPPISVGISGGVAALMGFVAVMHFPRSRSAMRALLDETQNPRTIVRPIVFAISLVLSILVPLQHFDLIAVNPRTATLSHLAGTAFGVATAGFMIARWHSN